MKDGPKKVLIVDDEEILTWIISKTLSKDRKKYEVMVANDGDRATEIMANTSVDLVITDIRMPGISGLDLLEHIREHYPQTKVIIMTAYGNPEVQREATDRGCLHYLEKPFKIEELRNLILDAVKVNKKGFVGRVSDMQLTDIIQLNCLGKMKTALSISKDDQEGMIYFQDGEIVHAECGKLSGEEALFTVVGWEGGDFTTKSGETAPVKTIKQPWQELLIEAMRRKDEGQLPERDGGEEGPVDLIDSESREPAPDRIKETEGFDAPELDYETGQPLSDGESMQNMISADAQEGASADYESKSILENIPKEDIEGPKITRPRSTREKAGMLQGMLQDWHNNTEEIQGAAVVSLEGLTLATHVSQGGITGEQLGVLTASIYKVGSKSVKALRRGMLEELYLRGGQGTIHLYVIGSKAILSVLARSDANMGMVHIESRELCKRVAQVLGH